VGVPIPKTTRIGWKHSDCGAAIRIAALQSKQNQINNYVPIGPNARSRNRPVLEIWRVTKSFVLEELGKIGENVEGEKKLFLRLSVWALACCEWRAAAPRLNSLRLPHARSFDSFLESTSRRCHCCLQIFPTERTPFFRKTGHPKSDGMRCCSGGVKLAR